MSILLLLATLLVLAHSQTIKMPLKKVYKQIGDFSNETSDVSFITEEEMGKRNLTEITKTMDNYFNLQYYSTLYLGTNKQELTFIYDTGSTTLWAPLANCSTCPSGSTKYSPAASYSDSGTDGDITYARGYVKGDLASDSVAVTSTSSSVSLSKFH
jgi:hypothetical protein